MPPLIQSPGVCILYIRVLLGIYTESECHHVCWVLTPSQSATLSVGGTFALTYRLSANIKWVFNVSALFSLRWRTVSRVPLMSGIWAFNLQSMNTEWNGKHALTVWPLYPEWTQGHAQCPSRQGDKCRDLSFRRPTMWQTHQRWHYTLVHDWLLQPRTYKQQSAYKHMSTPRENQSFDFRICCHQMKEIWQILFTSHYMV